MRLRPKFPPALEHMPDHAAHVVEVVRNVEGIELDYSVESLEAVDGALGGFHESGDDAGEMRETLFSFGAYIGEVMCHHGGGQWIVLEEDNPLGPWPVVDLGGQIANPVGKAFKRVRHGKEDDIPYFYSVFVNRPDGHS